MLQTNLELLLIMFGLYNSNCVFSCIWVFRGVFGFFNPKKRKAPYYWGAQIIKYELGKNLFFHPKTWEKLNLDNKIWKLHIHFRKRNRMCEKWVWWENNSSKIMQFVLDKIMVVEVGNCSSNFKHCSLTSKEY